MDDKQNRSQFSTIAIFSLGVICGIFIAALMGGVAWWFAETGFNGFTGSQNSSGGNDAGQDTTLTAQQIQAQIPADFPRTFIAIEDNGNYSAVLVKHGAKTPALPFTENSKTYWPALICLNAACPGRDPQGKDYIFAGVITNGKITGCPLCAQAKEKAAEKDKAAYNPENFSRYLLPQAQEILRGIRQRAESSGNVSQKQ